jgi:hypothetical protein
MSLNESTVEDAALEWSCLRAITHRQIGELGGRRVKSEIGRVKSRRSFPISLFTLHSFFCEAIPTLASLRDTLLPKLLSGELSMTAVESKLEAVL